MFRLVVNSVIIPTNKHEKPSLGESGIFMGDDPHSTLNSTHVDEEIIGSSSDAFMGSTSSYETADQVHQRKPKGIHSPLPRRRYGP